MAKNCWKIYFWHQTLLGEVRVHTRPGPATCPPFGYTKWSIHLQIVSHGHETSQRQRTQSMTTSRMGTGQIWFDCISWRWISWHQSVKRRIANLPEVLRYPHWQKSTTDDTQKLLKYIQDHMCSDFCMRDPPNNKRYIGNYVSITYFPIQILKNSFFAWLLHFILIWDLCTSSLNPI